MHLKLKRILLVKRIVLGFKLGHVESGLTGYSIFAVSHVLAAFAIFSFVIIIINTKRKLIKFLFNAN